MYRSKFLDPWDERCFELLVYLNNNSRSTSKEDCISYLNVSPKTLAKMCDSLTSIANETGFFVMENTQNRLKIIMTENSNASRVFFHLLSHSIKYKLIDELFNQNELQTIKLESELGISHATLYRKLDDLKEILATFNLKIHKKELQGSELQIRHFFLDFCMNTIPYDYLLNELKDSQIVAAVDLFKQTLEVNLDTEAELKFIVYLTIMRKRYHQGKIDEQKLTDEYPFFENDYDKTHKKHFLAMFSNYELKDSVDTFFTSLSNLFKVNFSNWESELFILFAMGNNIFPLNSAVFNNVIKIQSQSDSIVETIVNAMLDKLHETNLLEDGNFILQNYVRSLLNTICWNHEIYRGGIYMYTELKFDRFISLNKFDVIREYVVNFLPNSFPQFKKDDLQNKRFLVNLVLICLYSANHSNQSYKIGVSIKGDLMYRMLIEKHIINRVNSLGYVNAEVLDKNKKYDLVISNVNLLELEDIYQDFYLLNHQFTPLDFNTLELFIEKKAGIKKDATI
ncbi:DNA-binding protein [Companilactobacillus sp. RD055328]|uniref:helix-turn-helix domain-containing protein n=1 Tax=Companilactobacillus sp. RD055328 TaxID=2916634 RepID=UPI001FC886E4|nr:helix-turn-helix domain-containing protein [Companilactobacillus sp. RD055328]GKQ43193.1 DNA-binding protein [Companilactobacillus sp. RD055328]